VREGDQGKAVRDALTYVCRPTSEICSRKQETKREPCALSAQMRDACIGIRSNVVKRKRVLARKRDND